MFISLKRIGRGPGRIMVLVALLLFGGLAENALGQGAGNVSTIAGAFAGYVDGNNDLSQFNTPTGLVLDGNGNLLIADFGNNVIRNLRLSDNLVTTYIRGVTRPIALAVDAATNLYVVSQGNSSVLKYDRFNNFRGPLIAGLAQPTAVAVGADGNIYVAELAGVVRQVNSNGVVTATYTSAGRGSQFQGVAVLDNGLLVASDSANHVIWAFDGPGANPRLFAGTINAPGYANGPTNVARFFAPFQIAKGPNNSLVVADRFNERVRRVTCDGFVETLFGIDPADWVTGPGTYPGWWDGNVDTVEAREPYGVAVSSEGVVYDSEVYYHIVREGIGFAPALPCNSTGSTNVIVPTPILIPSAGFYPNGVTVQILASNDTQQFGPGVRLFYTLDGTTPTTNNLALEIPIINGQGQLQLDGPIDLSTLKVGAFQDTFVSVIVSGGTTVVPTPILSPNSGYYPMGTLVTITSTNGFPEGSLVVYTLDGTDPTTNSPPVQGVGDVRFVTVRDATIDLRSLKVKTFLGANVGTTVSGQPFISTNNPAIRGEIGIPTGLNGTNFYAGIGATIVLPVVANMRQDQPLRSLSFVVEVSAGPGAPWLTNKTQVRVLPISANDFVPVVAASTNLPVSLSSISGATNKLALLYAGTNAVFAVNNFAVVAMLAIEIRPGPDLQGNRAVEGEQYTIKISQLSSTADGGQNSIQLSAMPARTIQVRNLDYLVGDSSPGHWYNAGDFGDGRLGSDDINNAVFASFGFHVPYDFSDVFNAMDAYPPDTEASVGGDGEIRFLDWQTIFRREVGFDGNNWRRNHSSDGSLQAFPTTLSQQSIRALGIVASASDTVAWDRQVLLSAGVLQNISAGGTATVPVIARIDKGKSVSGMQFAAYVVGEAGAPGVQGVAFRPALGFPGPTIQGNTIPGGGNLINGVYAAWQLESFDPQMTGTVQIGTLEFTVPSNAAAGQHYTVYFDHPDGAAETVSGDIVQLDFETLRGAVWVYSPAATLPDTVPDEWKEYFFGALDSPLAIGSADPDHDGLSNREEYVAGSDPTHADARFSVKQGIFTFRWAGEQGLFYEVERTSDFKSWTPVAAHVPGNDAFIEYSENSTTSKTYFYRVRLDP